MSDGKFPVLILRVHKSYIIIRIQKICIFISNQIKLYCILFKIKDRVNEQSLSSLNQTNIILNYYDYI